MTALLRDHSNPTSVYLFDVKISFRGDRRAGGLLCEGGEVSAFVINEITSYWVEVPAGLQSAVSAMLLRACTKHPNQRDPPRSWMAGLATGVFLSSLF